MRCIVNVTQTIALCSAERELFDNNVEVRDSAASGEKNVEYSREKKKKKRILFRGNETAVRLFAL